MNLTAESVVQLEIPSDSNLSLATLTVDTLSLRMGQGMF